MTKPHLTDTSAHVFMAGATRSGKTVTANEAHGTFDGVSIFWNSEEESNILGFRVNSVQGVLQAIKTRGWNVKIDYVPMGKSAEQMNTELQVLQSMLFDLADRTGRSKPVQVCVDECQDYGRQGASEGPLHVLMRKGLKREIRVVAMSQDPATVDKVIIRQCFYNVWCGSAGGFYEPYFKTYHIPHEETKSLSQGDFVVFDSAMNKVGAGRSPARFA